MAPDVIIKALEQELAGYLRRGLSDRADQVRQELALLGGSDATIAETVPVEEGGTTPEKPVRRARKPVEAPKASEATAPAKPPRKARK